jgi:hypothetical protein
MEQKEVKEIQVIALPKRMATHIEQRLLKVVDTLTSIELRAFWCYKRGLKGLRKVSDSELLEARKAARCCIRHVLSTLGGENDPCMYKIIRKDEVLYCFIRLPLPRRPAQILADVEAFNLLPTRIQRELARKR